MNRRLMQEAKLLARKTVEDNIWKILIILLIAYLPRIICSLAIFTLMPKIDVTQEITMEQLAELYKSEAIMQFVMSILSVIFFPVVISATKTYLNMAHGKEANISDIFVNYSSIGAVIRSTTLYFGVVFKILFRLIPTVIYMCILSFLYDVMANVISEYVLLIPFFAMSFIIFYYMIGRVLLPIIYQNICILNFDNEEFSRRNTYRELKQIYNKRTGELSNFTLSFAGLFVLAMILSSFTVGLSTFLIYVYFNIALVHYTTKHHPQFLPNQPKY